nr:probable LRR receptor-like serine/threonine-protein kinase At1g34110 [Populus alba]
MKGPIDHISRRKLCKLQLLYLSNNDISGETVDLVAVLSGCGNASLEALQLVGNKLSGQIPGSTGHFKQLRSRYLQSNSFSGSIPSSIGSLNDLETLDLSSNAMNGTIPDSIGQLSKLVSLNLKWNSWIGSLWSHLSEFLSRNVIVNGPKPFCNNFSGELSPSLQNCTGLILLDLEENRLSGSITEWVGDNLSILSALPRGNMFSGNIPDGMQAPSSYEQDPPDFTVSYRQSMDLIVKGRQLEYNLTLGIIPDKIGSLQRLETLDLSNYHFSGPIPPSMSSMTSLNHLNLSYTNLSGPVPSTNQFQTFNDPSIYEVNAVHWLNMRNHGGNKIQESLMEDLFMSIPIFH